jgi:hypothetical protein
MVFGLGYLLGEDMANVYRHCPHPQILHPIDE